MMSTSIYAIDREGLLEVGSFGLSLVGSRLRSLGWARNEVHIAQIAVWDRCVGWAEMASATPGRELTASAVPPAAPFWPQSRGLRGQVVDTRGDGVAGVRVSWAGKRRGVGDCCCLTDGDGCFEVSLSDAETDAPTDEDDGEWSSSTGSTGSTVSFGFDREGFAPNALEVPCVPATEFAVQVTLRPISAAVVVDAAVGGSVVDKATGSSVTVPPNALSYPDGSPVTGPITVSLSVIDASDPASLASMPGDFSAVGADGSTVYLQSLGAAWVGALDEHGRELVVGPGSEGITLDLRSTATANASKLDTLPEMWIFYSASGKWELEPAAMKLDGQPAPNSARPARSTTATEGSASENRPSGPKFGGKKGKKAKKTGSSYKPEGSVLETGCMSPEEFRAAVQREGEKSFSATVTKLGYINCDLAYHHPQRAVMLTGRVLSAQGDPVPGLQLWSVGRDYCGRTPDVTDTQGKFGAMIAQFDSEVDVEVSFCVEVVGDSKLEVYFESLKGWRGSSMSQELKRLLELLPGQYMQAADSVEGYPSWERRLKKMGKEQEQVAARILWYQPRRQWQHLVGDVLACVRDEDDSPRTPFGAGWRLAPSLSAELGERIAPPTYQRPVAIQKKLFGPFRTGPPGDFVEIGDLLLGQ